MPNVNVYLSEDEYVDLAEYARHKGVKATAIARIAIRSLLAQQKTKQETASSSNAPGGHLS